MNTYTTIFENQEGILKRIPTGICEINWLYGYTYIDEKRFSWGLPYGKISLWAGAAGIGKSRVAKELARSIANTKGRNGIYYKSDYCYLEGGRIISIKDYIHHLRKVRPTVSILDSINQLEEFGGDGSDNNIKLIINGNKEQDGLRKIAEELEIHIILISQLNKNGEVRGSTTLSHLVDIVIEVDRVQEIFGIKMDNGIGDKYFEVRVGSKHRYGRIGQEFKCIWRHDDDKAVCISEKRLEDEIYCKQYNLKLRKTITVESIAQELQAEEEQKERDENRVLSAQIAKENNSTRKLLRLITGI